MFTTEGIILKKVDAGETGALFTVYTKDFGKMRLLAQGVKKEEAKLKGHLEPLNFSKISFVRGKNGERLTYADAEDCFPRIRENFEKLAHALEISSLIDEHCFPDQADNNLWDLLKTSFRELEEAPHINNFIPTFKKKLNECLGY